MDSTAWLARQGHRLLQLGVALLLFTSFEEFTALQEAVIRAMASSSAPTGIAAFALMFWGCGWRHEQGSEAASLWRSGNGRSA